MPPSDFSLKSRPLPELGIFLLCSVLHLISSKHSLFIYVNKCSTSDVCKDQMNSNREEQFSFTCCWNRTNVKTDECKFVISGKRYRSNI